MWAKVLLLAISTVLLGQVALGLKQVHAKPERTTAWAEIDGNVYYIVGFEGYSREQARAICGSYNMRLVTFETEDKWLKVVDYLANHYYYGLNFWLGAIKDQGSSTWYWEDTNEIIENFFWRTGEPDLNLNLNRTCIEFLPSFGSPGWGDNDCNLTCDIVCQ